MENGRDKREEYEDQDAEPTMMAPPGQRPSDTGLRDERSSGVADAADSGAADPDAVDADTDQERDAKP